MNLVSYNLRYGGKLGADNAWQRMMREFAPDIAFAQETFHPSRYFSSDEFSKFKGCVHADVKHGKWGCAILSKDHELEPLSLTMPQYKGWVVGARIPDLVIGKVPQSVLVFSIHTPSPGPYEPHVDRILSEIVTLSAGSPVILAGDFNLTAAAIRRPAEELKNTAGELKILERLRTELGLLNAWQYLHPNDDLPQTLRWVGNQSKPYHCDAIFLNAKHLRHLTSASIESSGVWGEMSDHSPVFVTLA